MNRLLAIVLLTAPAGAEPLRIVSWNVESGGNDPAVIARQLSGFERADLYCLQEVRPRNLGRYAAAIRDAQGKSYRYVPSTTGRDDRLLVVYDADRFELLEIREMFQYGSYVLNDWRHRSPLVLEMRDRKSDALFGVMTVHLARGDARRRQEQASGLREWAAGRQYPAIGIGDFNFDYDYRSRSGNKAFQAFLRDGSPWRWVRPSQDIDTNWSDRDGDGRDNYPDSCLDFAFISGHGLSDASSRVVVRPEDFPDDGRTSDHRPLELELTLGSQEGG